MIKINQFITIGELICVTKYFPIAEFVLEKKQKKYFAKAKEIFQNVPVVIQPYYSLRVSGLRVGPLHRGYSSSGQSPAALGK